MYCLIIMVAINLIISLKYDSYFLYSYATLFIYSALVLFKEYYKKEIN